MSLPGWLQAYDALRQYIPWHKTARAVGLKEDPTRQLEWSVPPGTPLFVEDDVLVSVLFLILLPVVFLPQKLWRRAAAKIARYLVTVDFLAERSLEFEKLVPPAITAYSGLSARDISINFYEAILVGNLEAMRAGLWSLKYRGLKVQGAEKLRALLTEGKGAIIWVEQSFSSSLLAKVALSQQGFRIHHVSRPGHGGTDSRFGMTFFGGITRRAEAPHLAERIVLTKAKQVAAMRRTREVLTKGGLVSITVSDTAAQVIEVPALGGELRLGSGAPHLAHSTGAPLVPVFCYQEKGVYTVEIGDPIALEGKNRERAMQAAGEAYAKLLEAFVARHSLDWSGWFMGAFHNPTEPSTVSSPEAKADE